MNRYKPDPTQQHPAPLSRCALCGVQFVCGAEAGLKECWCAHLPAVLPPLNESARCLCPHCLQREIHRLHG